ncbi:PAS domain S-box-containing protein/diguanylate cyclase (GGDEF) domain-containing protein [Thermostaphylospora chromogena]|uniref:PAS domain S-box-containing protein/diguanylate cyclase (GGDEF) domain-containing protein n=1 Tax=Thermostaphylospora chromogena TaxID=35622 RepID=A0A1H1AG64_9ACTN|nr:PAS domain S-box-containing protein/diguanylate cyclase (GGDEF) domain-containing protein [Thermostaphylospora chromogena]
MPLIAAAVTGAAGTAFALLAGASAAVVGAVTGGAAALLAVVSLVVAARRGATEQRRVAAAARWFALGSFIWLLGDLLRPIADGTSFIVTFADLPVVAGAGLIAVGCWKAAAPPVHGRAVLRHVTDAYLSAASLFLIGWMFILAPVREAGASGASVLPLVLPLLCLLTVCAVGPSVVTCPYQERQVGLAALGVLVAITVAETATALARIGGYDVPAVGVWPAPAAFLLLAAAASRVWRRRPSAAAETGEETFRGPIAAGVLAGIPLTLVALATVVVMVAFVRDGGGRLTPVTGGIAGSVVLVLVLRLFVLLAESAELRLRVRTGDRRLRKLAESSGDVVLVCDHQGTIHEVGGQVEAVYGYRPPDLAGGSVLDYVHPEDVPLIQKALASMSEGDDGEGACTLACRVRAADGTWRPAESVATPHPGDDDLVLISTRDVSDQEALRHQVAHLTFHDGITGLPNRAYFEERTREVLAGRSGGRSAVLFLDLDGFTAVNDSVGHASGDYLLAQAARRLRSAVRSDDTLARWGGDEFAVLVESGADAQVVVDLAERLVRAVSQEPFRVADRDIALTASVGVAFAEDGVPSADLIRNADVAMARAKELGGRRVEVFAAHMHADVVRRLELAADLQRALLEKQFALEFQPIVDLATSRVTAVEALVRWWRGSTFVPPEQFLGPAEDTGLIVPLSEWILKEACREVAAWRASSWDIGLSVNLSLRQITSPSFVESVSEALSDSGLPPSALTLEVVEEMLVEDAEEIISRLSTLRSLGIRLAIDDFGTGYASLAPLRQLPVDMVKIDPSFVAGLGQDETLTLLTRTIVRLGHDLGLIVVAEGIERPEQLELLREMGCTRGQGYLVARPMAARGVDSLMRTSLQSTA